MQQKMLSNQSTQPKFSRTLWGKWKCRTRECVYFLSRKEIGVKRRHSFSHLALVFYITMKEQHLVSLFPPLDLFWISVFLGWHRFRNYSLFLLIETFWTIVARLHLSATVVIHFQVRCYLQAVIQHKYSIWLASHHCLVETHVTGSYSRNLHVYIKI